MPPPARELLRRTLGCVGASVVALVGAVVLLMAIAWVEEAVRPGFDSPVPTVAIGTLVVAGALLALVLASRRR